LILLALLTTAAWAETWQTTRGQHLEGKISGVYGPLVVIADRKSSSAVPMEELNDADLARVAAFVAAKPAQAASWSAASSKVSKALKGRLQILGGEKLAAFEPGARGEPEFYLVYFGAGWCPPCREFSPKLVAAYQRLKATAPDRFEAVFVSSDRDAGDFLKYIQHVRMPWPVLKFNDRGSVDVIERWAGTGIPCLVVVTREGDALLHSYRGTEYVGPYDVLERFETLLHATDASDPAARRLMHRMAVMQHIHAAGTGDRAAAPYVVTMDLARYQTLEVKRIVATLDLDERGHVQDVALEPELPTVLNYQLIKDAGDWLFLPAVEKGHAVRKKARLPLQLQ
jgi:thiol-disulfide isomerase/thioredoxin